MWFEALGSAGFLSVDPKTPTYRINRARADRHPADQPEDAGSYTLPKTNLQP
jgi:hypothetical protein